MKVSSVSQMREMDKTATQQFGIPETLLMENAGLAAYSVILDNLGITNKTYLVFCGIGNNGGDGFVVARKIHSAGGEVKVFILGDQSKYKGAAKENLDIISSMPIEIREIDSARSVKKDIAHCYAIVDAIFGTGLTREIDGLFRDVIEAINKSAKTVISLDIPSGVNGDTGKIMGCAIQADYTISFGLPKIGNMLMPGYELCGELFNTYISFPPQLHNSNTLKVEINEPPILPPRNPEGHKGFFGEALFIAGASSYFGAPYFSAMSFLKAGGGYSRLAAPASITPFIANKGGEIVFIPQTETKAGSISLENRDALLILSENMDIVILGPGLSLNDETAQLVQELAKGIQKPLLIDGDGITAICNNPGILKKRKAPTILTPHLGEMSRITNIPVQDIEKNIIEILQKTSRELNAIIVLKGANTLIGYPDERIYINISGNSGMATAGSGDVLTGTIAAMFCLGLSLEDAVRKGVFIHGVSGDLASIEKGEDGMIAQDILDHLPHAVHMDREDLLKDLYSGVQMI